MITFVGNVNPRLVLQQSRDSINIIIIQYLTIQKLRLLCSIFNEMLVNTLSDTAG